MKDYISPILEQARHRLAFLLLGIASMVVIVGTLLVIGTQETSATRDNPEEISSLEEEAPDPFKDIRLEARGAYVFDLARNEVLFAQNENEQLPLASLTKIMTALVAYDSLNPSALITIIPRDLLEEGDSGLYVDERWRMENLIDVMLIVSSNDAAYAVARFVGSAGNTQTEQSLGYDRFISAMNEKAQELELDSLQFYNSSGLDLVKDATPVVSGGYGSARDMGLLLARLFQNHPTSLEATRRDVLHVVSQSNLSHTFRNTNSLLGEYPGLIGSKTGFTDLAGGNLALLINIGIDHPVVAVVLGSTREGRFSDMRKLTAATIKYFE